MVFADTMDAFNNYVEPHSVLMRMEDPPSEAALLQIPGATKVDFLTERTIRLYFNGDPDITGKIISASVHNDWQLREITLDKSSLDEIFAQLSGPSSK